MSCADWKPIDGFRSPGEFRRFRAWIADAVDQGVAQRVPVDPESKDANVQFEEWYRCEETGQIWSLLLPDPPSRGAFVAVDS